MANNARVWIYNDRAGDWRWRLQGANGRIVADSAEGYTRRGDCLRAWRAVAGLVSEQKNIEIVMEEA